ncbi:unnamed protein product, partial [marine sediment metagenome]
VRFTRADGTVVKVTSNYDFWLEEGGEGEGDWRVPDPEGFRRYCRKLLEERGGPGSSETEAEP